MHNKLLTYGLKDNKLTHIDDVENGIKCLCICSYCKEPLIARNNGKKKQHHFAHSSGAECEKAYESALHLLAKEIFEERKSILLPQYYPYNYIEESKYLKKEKPTLFHDVLVEKRIQIEDIIIKPDAIGILNEKEIYIEFAYSHFVDDTKRNKLIELKINCVEYDLRFVDLDRKDIILFFEKETENRKWINNVDSQKEYDLFIENKYIQLNENIIEGFKSVYTIRIPKYFGSNLANYEQQNYKTNDAFHEMELKYSVKSEFIQKAVTEISNRPLFVDVTDFELIFITDDNYEQIIIEQGFKSTKPEIILKTKHPNYLFIKIEHFRSVQHYAKYNYQDLIEINKSVIVFELPEFFYSKSEIVEYLKRNIIEKKWLTNPKGKIQREGYEEELLKLALLYQNENSEKLNKYRNDRQFKLINSKYLKQNCPKRKGALESLKSSSFYKHNTLQKIIDGAKWNLEIYGKGEMGKYIYLNNEQIVVYKNEFETTTIEEDRLSNWFFAGLKEIQKLIGKNVGNCKSCSFYKEEIWENGNEVIVCSHKSQ